MATGTTRSALHHNVKSKEEQLGRLVEGVVQDSGGPMKAIVGDPILRAQDKLREMTVVSVTEHALRPVRVRLLDRSDGDLSEPLATRHRQAKRQTLERMVAVLQEGVEILGRFVRLGAIRPP